VALVKRWEQPNGSIILFWLRAISMRRPPFLYRSCPLYCHPESAANCNTFFEYLQSRVQPLIYGLIPFRHLLVSQFNMMDRFDKLLTGRSKMPERLPARIIIKLNNLQEKAMINKLYEANNAE